MSRLTVRLEYVHPWPNAAGLYVVRDREILLKQGIDFEISYGGYDRGDPVTLLERGEADIAVVPPNRLVNARNNGADVVAVAAINQVPLEAVITTKKTGISRPRDLAGRTLGLMPSSRLETLVRYTVDLDGGDGQAVDIRYTSGYEPDITDVIDGNYDSVLNIKAWEPLLGGLDVSERVVLPFNEWGGPAYPSYLWVVRGTLIRRNPELVQKFVDALRVGYEVAENEPEAAVSALQKSLLNRRPSIIAESLSIVKPTWRKEGTWGIIDEDDVSSYVKWLAEHQLLKSTDGLDGAINNDFVKAAVK